MNLFYGNHIHVTIGIVEREAPFAMRSQTVSTQIKPVIEWQAVIVDAGHGVEGAAEVGGAGRWKARHIKKLVVLQRHCKSVVRR